MNARMEWLSIAGRDMQGKYQGCEKFSWGLFVAEGVDGVEIGGFDGGIRSKNNSDDGANNEAENGPIDRDFGRNFEKVSSGVSGRNSQDHPNDTANFAKHNGFHDELSHDVPFLRTDGAANADLLGSFGNGDQHDVHNADAGGEKRNGADERDAGANFECEVAELRDHGVVGKNLEVI